MYSFCNFLWSPVGLKYSQQPQVIIKADRKKMVNFLLSECCLAVQVSNFQGTMEHKRENGSSVHVLEGREVGEMTPLFLNSLCLF